MTQTADTSIPAPLAGTVHPLFVATLAFAGLLGTLMQALFVPVLPSLAAQLGEAPTSVSWLVTALLLSGVISSAVFGRLADMFGKRRMILVALGIFIVGSILGALTALLPVLIVARVLQGVSLAIVPIAIGALRDHLQGRGLIRGVALISTLTGVGATLGAVVGGVLAQFLPWQWLFIGSAAFGAIGFLAVLAFVPSASVERRERIDVVGALGLAVALVALLLGISKGGSWGWASAATLLSLIGGAVVLGLWAWYELRAREPLVDLRILANRPVLFVNLLTLVTGFGMYGIMIAGPQFSEIPASTGFGLGASVLVAGLVLLPSAAFAVASPFVATRLIHGRGPRASLVVGTVFLIVGYGQLLVWHDSIWSLVVANILIAVGISFTFSATPIALATNVPGHRGAEANGVNGVFRTIGTSTAAAFVSVILAAFTAPSGAGNGYPALVGFIIVFAVGAVAGVLALPLIAAVPRRRTTEEE